MTHRIWNFQAGPAMLPTEVMEEAAKDFCDYKGAGMSLMEMSHRDKTFQGILDEASLHLRRLLEIPENYGVVFFPGGASLQFSCVPLNWLGEEEFADFSLTGVWATKALEEALEFNPLCQSVFLGKNSKFTEIPSLTDNDLHPKAKYLHITSNNTIYGTRYSKFPDVSVPLVADMTSELLSRPVPWNKFQVVFAGAQKNIGPSGLTVVIYNKDLLPKKSRKIPKLMDYRLMEENGSLYNTPPTFSIYIALLVFRWLERKGGIPWIEKENERKAALLYDFLQECPFFDLPVPKEHRSIMNVVFTTKNGLDEAKLLSELEKNGFSGLKGYRTIGGFRASIYNAMPFEGVQALVDFLRDFTRTRA